MNYDRRASSPQFPTLAEAMENAFQGWCLSVVLYGLRDDHDIVFDNQSMKKGGASFSIEGFLRDRDGRPDPFRRFVITFTLNGDKIAVEAVSLGMHVKHANKRWLFNGNVHYDAAAKTIADFIATFESTSG